MQFKITAVKTVTDPIERARRLANLYRLFENGLTLPTGPSEATAADSEAARPGEPPTARHAGQGVGRP